MGDTTLADVRALKSGDAILWWQPEYTDSPKFGRWRLGSFAGLIECEGALVRVRVVANSDTGLETTCCLDDVKSYRPHSVFLAVRDCSWGTGATEAEAVRKWRNESGARSKPGVYLVSNGCTMNSTGSIFDVAEPQHVSGPCIWRR